MQGIQQEQLVEAIVTMARVLDYRALEELNMRLSKMLANDMYMPHRGRGGMGGGGSSSFRGGYRGDHNPFNQQRHHMNHHQQQHRGGGGGRGFSDGFPHERRRYDDHRDGPGYGGNGDAMQSPQHHHRGRGSGGGRGRGGAACDIPPPSSYRKTDSNQENRKWAQSAEDVAGGTEGEKEPHRQRKPAAARRGRRRPNQGSGEKE
ncbi:hypothetical protein TraAM80_06529 [Trypanosoma rangeli]|uniref:Uncharacterized protein n=1 Tax=Trypanosoma rangeli TaxID=5698 RepID=A0A3R7MGP1_TRYRA|nr:uncharacterized protein TraAM80_06529 [Trypanosoma rangeli]RNF02201.1 hypothetical protein TraAM80_06529 [Trypanosoma rangeli]|eukprot:RNF02201.1 hypothetical protein TraAM80_06529 [Trypanosoma rangeli]